jgi:hypothetical protein
VLNLKDQPLVELPLTFRQKILMAIANPNLAYILLMLGLLGLYFEFANPGAIFFPCDWWHQPAAGPPLFSNLAGQLCWTIADSSWHCLFYSGNKNHQLWSLSRGWSYIFVSRFGDINQIAYT